MGLQRVAVLISGHGSNLRALIDAARDPDAGYAIVAVISNVTDAFGLSRAREAGIATIAIDPRRCNGRDGFDAAMQTALDHARVDLVCLAGFMRILGAAFVSRWRNRLLNIHPSLLPAFPGLDTHGRAIAAGVRVAGCTVHLVRQAIDSGPILAQAVVPVLCCDDPATLAQRVLAMEHVIYPRTLTLFAAGRLAVLGGGGGEGEDERVIATDAEAEALRLALHPSLMAPTG